MKTKSFILAVIATMCISNTSAQKLTYGSLSFLKDEEKLNVIIDYSDVLIQGKSEKFIYAMNGEAWAKKWEAAKPVFYQRFNAHLNKNLNYSEGILLCGNFSDAQYTMTVASISFGRNWDMKGEVIFTKTGDSTILAKFELMGASRIHKGHEFFLVASSFSYAGQNLGQFLAKTIK